MGIGVPQPGRAEVLGTGDEVGKLRAGQLESEQAARKLRRLERRTHCVMSVVAAALAAAARLYLSYSSRVFGLPFFPFAERWMHIFLCPSLGRNTV